MLIESWWHLMSAFQSVGGKSIVPKGCKPLVGMMASSPLFALKGSSKLILTSSAVNQQSWEDETELKAGVFSYYLLQGLKDRAADDIWINGDDLVRFVKTYVAKAIIKLKGMEQDPQIVRQGNFAPSPETGRRKKSRT